MAAAGWVCHALRDCLSLSLLLRVRGLAVLLKGDVGGVSTSAWPPGESRCALDRCGESLARKAQLPERLGRSWKDGPSGLRPGAAGLHRGWPCSRAVPACICWGKGRLGSPWGAGMDPSRRGVSRGAERWLMPYAQAHSQRVASAFVLRVPRSPDGSSLKNAEVLGWHLGGRP